MFNSCVCKPVVNFRETCVQKRRGWSLCVIAENNNPILRKNKRKHEIAITGHNSFHITENNRTIIKTKPKINIMELSQTLDVRLLR